jgi:hypothetical protein
MIEQIEKYRFTSGELPIALVRRRLAEIANRLNLKIYRWEEDGLGPAQGLIIRLASGRVMLLLELEHAIKHHRVKGPEILVEARDLAEVGVEPLIVEVQEALDLTRDELDWIAPEENRETAIRMRAMADRRMRERDQPSSTGREH